MNPLREPCLIERIEGPQPLSVVEALRFFPANRHPRTRQVGVRKYDHRGKRA